MKFSTTLDVIFGIFVTAGVSFVICFAIVFYPGSCHSHKYSRIKGDTAIIISANGTVIDSSYHDKNGNLIVHTKDSFRFKDHHSGCPGNCATIHFHPDGSITCDTLKILNKYTKRQLDSAYRKGVRDGRKECPPQDNNQLPLINNDPKTDDSLGELHYTKIDSDTYKMLKKIQDRPGKEIKYLP
jgi:hypothetical protein